MIDDTTTGDRVAQEPQTQEPQTDVERIVAAVWSDLLGKPVTDTRTSIFALGAHSLTIARCLGRLREMLGVELTSDLFFRYPTIEAFASALASGPAAARVSRRASLVVQVMRS